MIEPAARGAWRELEGRLRPFVARRVPTPADADDVVQEVMLRLSRGLPDLRDDDRFGPWVYRIARNAIADHLRDRVRHPLAGDDRVLDDLPPAPDDDEERDAERALAIYVAHLVATLPSPYREALTLVELEGLSHKEAAALAGVTLTAMKSRVRRGRAEVRRLLEACCAIALDARGHVIDCTPRGDRIDPCNPSRSRCS